MPATGRAQPSPLATWAQHLRNAPLRAGFAIGFCILFAFIGTFTFVNFVLVRDAAAVGPMAAGLRLLRLPAVDPDDAAGRPRGAAPRHAADLLGWLARRRRSACRCCCCRSLPAVLVGLVLVGVGTFFAQATATGFVGRAATTDRGSASGIYLACYFLGGLVGSAVLGQVFDRLGWTACVIGIGLSLLVAAALTFNLRRTPRQTHA